MESDPVGSAAGSDPVGSAAGSATGSATGSDPVGSAAGSATGSAADAAAGSARPFQLRRDTDFESGYAAQPPWDIGRPQPAFVALAESGQISGRVLDVGCGTGEHALMCAALGMDAVGVDLAPTAIAKARAKAADRNLAARFVVGDALDLAALGSDLGGPFDTVLDCGVFHVFDDENRGRFADNLASVTRPGGRLFLLCFNEHQPGEWGPRRVTQEEIRATFDGNPGGWRVDSIEASRLVVTFLPDGVHAWRAALTRT